jgi:hypothetical protein
VVVTALLDDWARHASGSDSATRGRRASGTMLRAEKRRCPCALRHSMVVTRVLA